MHTQSLCVHIVNLSACSGSLGLEKLLFSEKYACYSFIELDYFVLYCHQSYMCISGLVSSTEIKV